MADEVVAGTTIERAKRYLDIAKREPGHSPTEDALIDLVECLIDELESLQEQIWDVETGG